jgi:hypothetical protein
MPSVPVTARGPAGASGATNATGVALLSLAPGTYQLNVDTNLTVNAQTVRFQAHGEVVVPPGGKEVLVTLRQD